VGMMVLATLLITAVLAAVFGKLPQFHGTYTIYVRFREAPGVSADTPVRKSGIRIGRVSKVQFATDEKTKRESVLVTVEIDKDRRLRHNEVCRVGATLLGDASLQFVLDPKATDDSEIQDSETVDGVVASEPVQAITDLQGQLSVAIVSVAKTSDEIGEAAAKIHDLLVKNEDRISRVIEQSDGTLQAIQKMLEATNEIVSDPQTRAQLKDSITRMPQMMKDAHDAVLRMRSTMDLVDKNLRNVEDFTRPLGERGGSVVERLDQGAQKLDTVMTEMTRFTQALNNQEGSLGQLVNNPELYQHLNRAAKNIDDLSRQLKPILDDTRVFTDKVSRHPGVIVTDAIRPGPGIK